MMLAQRSDRLVFIFLRFEVLRYKPYKLTKFPRLALAIAEQKRLVCIMRPNRQSRHRSATVSHRDPISSVLVFRPP
jgi:hypothetical protein